MAAKKQAVYALLIQTTLLPADAVGSLPVAEVHPWASQQRDVWSSAAAAAAAAAAAHWHGAVRIPDEIVTPAAAAAAVAADVAAGDGEGDGEKRMIAADPCHSAAECLAGVGARIRQASR